MCGKFFKRKREFNRHIDSHNHGKFLCPAREGCREFKRREHLKSHLRNVHCWAWPRKVLKKPSPEDSEQVHDEEKRKEG